MLSTPNGCMCHRLPEKSQPCLACRARANAEKTCDLCLVGLLSETEIELGRCTNCQEG